MNKYLVEVFHAEHKTPFISWEGKAASRAEALIKALFMLDLSDEKGVAQIKIRQLQKNDELITI